MRRLRVGCVGTGFIAGRHLRALAGFVDVELVAVADVDARRAEQVAAVYGARAYGDGSALLAEERLDAVWLCVPPFAHGPLEAAALERDLPFFVEKPLAADLDTAVVIAQRVEDQALPTAVGYHWRALSVVATAAALTRASPVRLVTGAWLDSTPPAPWWSRRDRSGGQLIEQTTHLFDLVRLLVGEVDSVQAVETPTGGGEPAGRVPAASAVLLQFGCGAVGTMCSSRVLDRRVRVGVHLVLDGTSVDVCERALSDHELRVVGGTGEHTVQTDEDPIAAEDRAFIDALLSDSPGDGLVPYAEALRTHSVVCAADRSARSGGTRVPVGVAPVRPWAGRSA